jgi:signal peptidase II
VHQPEDPAPVVPAAEVPNPAAVPEPAARHAPWAGRFRLHWWLILGIVAFDQATKAVVLAFLPLYDSVTVIPGLMDLVHVRNAGVAFGFLNDLESASRGLVTTALALAALAGITYYARHIRPHEHLARIGLSLILGGAVGNLIDRMRTGYVTDFVDVYWQGWHFWAFNVADASITIGAILVFLDLLVVNRHVSDPV